MALNEKDAWLLQEISQRIRAEFASAVLLQMYKAGWSPTRCDRVIREALNQVEKLDAEVIEDAMGDLLDVGEAERALEARPGHQTEG
jgi:hypothetical protein